MISSLCLNTLLLVLALAYYSMAIQGISPLELAGIIPATFIEGKIDMELKEPRVIIDFSDIGIGGYDIYRLRVEVPTYVPNYENFTDSWDGWALDRSDIKTYGLEPKDKVIGNYSLWFDVKHSDVSNAWIRYGQSDLNLNLTGYNALALYIKANTSLLWKHEVPGGGTAIFMGTGDWSEWNFFKYELNITTDWQCLVIPFQKMTQRGHPSLADIDYIIISLHAVPGSPDYRIWIDGLSFVRIEKTSIYCNGVKTDIFPVSPAIQIDDVWAWFYVYGRNPKTMFRDKIILLKHGPAEPRVTLFLRLYPGGYRCYGYVDPKNWSGIAVDVYTWENMSNAFLSLGLHDLRLVISLPENAISATLNSRPIPLDLNRTTIYIYKPRCPLRNVIVISITKEDRYVLKLYSEVLWIIAPFYFMSKALWMLQGFRGFNYYCLFFYVLTSVTEIEIFLFLHKRRAVRHGRET